MQNAWLFAIMVALLSGCTHKQLTRNTALTATTVNSIQYQMVVDNLAAISCDPGTLPSHVRLADGTVQISNQAGMGESGGFTTFSGTKFGIEQFGPNAQTRVSEQWGTDAVENPIQVWELGVLYRRVLGLPLPPTPNFIQEAIEEQARKSKNGKSSNGNGNGSSNGSGDQPDLEEVGPGMWIPTPHDVSQSPRRFTPLPIVEAIRDQENGRNQTGVPAESRSQNVAASSGQRNAHKPLTVEEYDLPIGWFGLGSKHDVPKNARFVGRCKDRYAWVTPEGMEGLSQFTLAILTVTKLDPGEERGGSGMMYIP